ncbi:BatA domain-containing protein [Pedobacter mucosus]|uniref:BatA domain-containing protein n=1 Tax=Pedobacter mucosus TaxID=2895286 RepID=UPI001EE49D10|nr:BatA domain-containing protein [Pedobacter mucosus]UKT66050.1 BatA domain-containing protein [Pedobacter mucosus]
MQFLYPIGLLALAGLIIPLIIHLWNVKQGKTLKIGSIALLGESSRASSKSFKINDWLLLLLRCLLLILLSFILAQPFIKKTLSGKNLGWVLVEKSNFPKVYKDNRKTVDSLTKLGFEIHDFNVGFAPLSLKDTLNTDTTKLVSVNTTSLLNQLNQIIPAGNSVYLFAKHRLNTIGTTLPQINYKLNWKPLNEADTLSSWITDYAGKKYEAKSTPTNTVYTAVNNNDAASIKIAIYEPSGNADKKYLIAALNAIGSFSGRRIEINPTEKADIGFWLADIPVTSTFKSAINANGTLFQYEKGKVVTETSFINLEGTTVNLSKRIDSKDALNKVWEDGFGNAVLSTEKVAALNIYFFYNRFNPQWNQLVWNDIFVKALMPIVIRNEKAQAFGFEDHEADQRQLAANQKEIIQINKATSTSKTTKNESIANMLWIAALLILLIERILSFSNKTNVYVKN